MRIPGDVFLLLAPLRLHADPLQDLEALAEQADELATVDGGRHVRHVAETAERGMSKREAGHDGGGVELGLIGLGRALVGWDGVW